MKAFETLFCAVLAIGLTSGACTGAESSAIDADAQRFDVVGCALRDYLDGAKRWRSDAAWARLRRPYDIRYTDADIDRAIDIVVAETREPDRRRVRAELEESARRGRAIRMPLNFRTGDVPFRADNAIDITTMKVLAAWNAVKGVELTVAAADDVRGFQTHLRRADVPSEGRAPLGPLADLYRTDLLISFTPGLNGRLETPTERDRRLGYARRLLWQEGLSPDFTGLSRAGLDWQTDPEELAMRSPTPPGDAAGALADRTFRDLVPRRMGSRHYCADGRLMAEHARVGSPDTVVGHWRLESIGKDGALHVIETRPHTERRVMLNRLGDGTTEIVEGSDARVMIEGLPRACPARLETVQKPCSDR